MRRLSSLSAALAVFAIAATSAAGPVSTKEARASGRIERVDVPTRSVVIMQGSHEATFVLAPEARVMQGTKTLQPADLVADVGHQATIRYTTSGATKLAHRVDVGGTAVHTPKAPRTK